MERGGEHAVRIGYGGAVFPGGAVLRMPAYRGKLEPGDLDALWAYVKWLRASR